MSNNLHKQTDKTVCKETGLTPLQEKAAILLASGQTITDVATNIGVQRNTLYEWLKKVVFVCYLNSQRKEQQSSLRNGLLSLYADAIRALKEVLNSEDNSNKLKAAMMIISRVDNEQVGEVDPKAILKKQASTHINSHDEEVMNMFAGYDILDEDKYQKLLVENGLE